jgi:hypothetical protein
VERALKPTRKELTSLLGEDQPAITGETEKEQAWIGPWNELWGATHWPSISRRMACAIQVELDTGRDILGPALGRNWRRPL